VTLLAKPNVLKRKRVLAAMTAKRNAAMFANVLMQKQEAVVQKKRKKLATKQLIFLRIGLSQYGLALFCMCARQGAFTWR